MRFRNPFLSVLFLLLLTSLACSLGAQPAPPPGGPPSNAQPTQAPPPTQAGVIPSTASAPTGPVQQTIITSTEEQALMDLYQRVNLSVVAIVIEGDGGDGLGSGFVIDAEGHIVTNHHVVEGAGNIEVDFSSGLKARARVLGTDPDSDLAVIKVDVPADQLTPIPLGDSDQVQVGQRVFAVGNPFGLSGTMTVGIISGLGRTLESTRITEGVGRFSAPDIIQTDAAINPGNSGGPLINLKGEVIGVNKAIESETGTNSGVGFAIAANTVKQIVPFLINDGEFVYPYLGVSSLPEVSLRLQEQLDLPTANGAYVTSVTPDGPADQGGLRADSAPVDGQGFNGDGDLIVAIDGRPVQVFSDLLSYLVNHTRPGQVVTLTVLREGKQMEVEVTLGERP